MRVVAIVHGFPPTHPAGAEWTLHNILRALVERGHECRVQVAEPWPAWTGDVDGVTVSRDAGDHADLVITHLDESWRGELYAQAQQAPLVRLAHSAAQVGAACDLVVANSEHVLDVAKQLYPAERTILCRPVVWSDEYHAPQGEHDHVTLVNVSAQKGAHVFYRLAERYPDRRFLGVTGAYGVQYREAAANVEIAGPFETDMWKVYARTRVLLMPSVAESWGRCAVEAAASGVPTIATPTLGLREALGVAGVFAAEGDVDGWAAALEWLDDARAYQHVSRLARRRSRELDKQARSDLDGLCERLEALGEPRRRVLFAEAR
jgi:glycosyltransferase involved in cell wall biosynthesis